MKRMLTAELIVTSFKRRAAHPEGWAAWAKAHPFESSLLNEGAALAEGLSDGE
jgi:hypothetical protein